MRYGTIWTGPKGKDTSSHLPPPPFLLAPALPCSEQDQGRNTAGKEVILGHDVMSGQGGEMDARSVPRGTRLDFCFWSSPLGLVATMAKVRSPSAHGKGPDFQKVSSWSGPACWRGSFFSLCLHSHSILSSFCEQDTLIRCQFFQLGVLCYHPKITNYCCLSRMLYPEPRI